MAALKRGFELAMKNINEKENRMYKAGLLVAYNYIMAAWPVHTGFSKANNRVNIGGGSIGRIEPNERPDPATGKDALLGKAAAVQASQTAKIRGMQPLKRGRTRRVVIGNAVDYASDVGFSPGKGANIYRMAAAKARMRMRSVK